MSQTTVPFDRSVANKLRGRMYVAMFFAAYAVAGAGAARASTPEQDCVAAMLKAAGKFAQCRYNSEAGFFKDLDGDKHTLAGAKCGAKLDVSIAKAIEKYGDACPDLAAPAALLLDPRAPDPRPVASLLQEE